MGYDPGAQHYAAKYKIRSANELWRWRVSDLWEASADLPVSEVPVELLLDKVKPQLWPLPWGQEVDLTDDLSGAVDRLRRVRTQEALYGFIEHLTSLVGHLHGSLVDPRGALTQLQYHWDRIQAVDLRWPILLAANGDIMDGRHRVARAALDGFGFLRTQRFKKDPPPREKLRFDSWADYLDGKYEVIP